MHDVTSILHLGKFYFPHQGGIETYLRTLVRHQSAYAKVEVLVAGSQRHTTRELMDGALITRTATFGQIASMPLNPSLLWELRRRTEPLVHLHTPNPGAAAAFLLSGHRGRLVVTHHGDTTGRAVLKRISDPFVRRVMERASAVIVTSQRYLDTSAELYPFQSKCHVISLGLDTDPKRVVDENEVARVRALYGPRFILATGRLVPYKGFEYLIQAMRGTQANLVLIGSGPELDRLRMKANSVGVADRIHFLGYVEDLAPYFNAAELFVLPSVSRAEAFGLVQLEAMMAGLPVINTHLDSGVPDVSLDRLTGITVPPEDSEALANAIRELLDQPQLRLQYGKAARTRAATFSSDVMAERHFDLYRQVLKETANTAQSR